MIKASSVVALLTVLVAGQALADWNEGDPYKYVQLPNLTETGVDIKVDEGIVLADDFLCESKDKITDVHIWGSWKEDLIGEINLVGLSIHDNVPAVWDPAQGLYEPSQPGPERWYRDVVPEPIYDSAIHAGYFTVRQYADIHPQYEWWWEVDEVLIQNGDQQVWQINCYIDEDEAFMQEGDASAAMIYWLDLKVDVNPVGTGTQPEFGWKTSQEHFEDDAVIWDDQLGVWKELRYPLGHPMHDPFDPANPMDDPAIGSVDMAFVITPEPATMTLIGLGGLAVLLRRRRR